MEDNITVTTLKETGDIHNRNISDWTMFGLAFKAGRPFIQECLKQHPKESADNWKKRVKEGFNFPYSQNIVNIYNYFLTEKPAVREVDASIAERKDWKEFQKDCSLYNTKFDVFLNDSQKLAGAYGTSGILVDCMPGKFAKDNKPVPYCSLYTPNNILDWKYERDLLTGRPELTYLKLKDGERTYLIWTKEGWGKYRLDADERDIEDWQEGVNSIGIVPFVWFPNIQDIEYPYLGVSDITDAAYVNAAVIRALSMGNEVMTMAGFPMLMMPMEDEVESLSGSGGQEEITISESSVLDFDPEFGTGGQPRWLESPVKPSIEAILAWLDRITEEMYRAALLHGVHQNRDKAQTKSGTALRFEFAQTNSALSKKADSLVEVEKKIIYLWGLWQDKEDVLDKIEIARVKEFSIDAMNAEIENMITSMEHVMSDHFKSKMQVRLAKYSYPDLSEKDINTIREETKENLEKEKEEEVSE